MQTGILLGFLSYFVYACSDALIKYLGGHLPVFEIGFFTSVFAILPALLTKERGDSWKSALVPRHPKLVLLRMTSGTAGGILAVVAFTSLPLAEAYALIFLLPIFVTVLSTLILKEPVGWKRWSAVITGLVGVMLVVRPGFREILPGHLAAVGCAFCGAVTVIVLRVLGPTERRITLIGSVVLSAFVVNAILMIPTYVAPEWSIMPFVAAAGLCAGSGHLIQVYATRAAPANRVAPTQYSQIIWAALIGALFFDEFPDAFGVAGMTLVAFSGLFTFLREEKRSGWSWRTPLDRNRV
ncbi:membrane protein [Aureimonas sp. SA4125]|uniref:DMT family transporter n=1 Tax=Aureimonas sp. SA4125 TaxID=2826993 RepID=UPI001CC71BA8|nr:DMT family transporter [Aureimonas sp. SA4125]BDA86249.1 membrane protein [Aureimonas sp. SA4125]